MHYHFYDLYRQSLMPVNTALDLAHDIVTHEKNPLSKTRLGRLRKAILESTIRLLKHYPKQGFEYEPVVIDGVEYPVHEEVVVEKPFCNLLRFRREGLPANAPKLLCVAALSGHHATLSRETFGQFLDDYEVYVTDWLDARDVPLSEGKFGFEEYVQYVIEFMEHIGPGNHMFAICQAAVPGLVAVAHMCKHNHPARPKSLIMMAGPIDIRINPNKFGRKVEKISAPLLRRVAIHRVPSRYDGAGRKVYPGMVQLGGFMSMNMRSHAQKHIQFFKDIAEGKIAEADRHRDFYDEYMGETIDCGDIKDVAILTLEGEKDDMISLGQTEAALHLCTHLPKKLKKHYVQMGVGHYGIFNGSKYREFVAPLMKDWINRHNK